MHITEKNWLRNFKGAVVAHTCYVHTWEVEARGSQKKRKPTLRVHTGSAPAWATHGDLVQTKTLETSLGNLQEIWRISQVSKDRGSFFERLANHHVCHHTSTRREPRFQEVKLIPQKHTWRWGPKPTVPLREHERTREVQRPTNSSTGETSQSSKVVLILPFSFGPRQEIVSDCTKATWLPN